MKAVNQPKVVHVLEDEFVESEPWRSLRLGSSGFRIVLPPGELPGIAIESMLRSDR